jgi:predicted ABC-type exoprotein transport system permease subunit
MTASNHAITGALIAVVVPAPVLAIAMSFIAHFIMDALPHFGVNQPDALKRNKDKRFIYVLIYDVALAGILVILLPILLGAVVPIWLSAVCMIACMSPDLVWGWRFYHEIRTGKEKPKSLFSQFHSWIQWSESAKGVLAEVLWASVVITVLVKSI